MKSFAEFLKERNEFHISRGDTFSSEFIKFGVHIDHTLLESFEPKKVDFIKKSLLNGKIGIFTTKEHSYCVVVSNDGEVGFLTGRPTIDPNSIKRIVDVFRLFNTKSTNLINAISVFNQVIYVITELIRESKPKQIKFSGLNDMLDRLYSKMVKDKSFTKLMNNNGYDYAGKFPDNSFVFNFGV